MQLKMLARYIAFYLHVQYFSSSFYGASPVLKVGGQLFTVLSVLRQAYYLLHSCGDGVAP